MTTTHRRDGFALVVLLLLAAGWAANHFAAMIPVVRDREDLSATALAGAFGIYAVGLLPGLLGGGGLSDRVGRRPVVLAGSLVAASGNLLMLLWHPVAGIYSGRLVVGVGVGLAMGAGTAWAGDLRGRRGTTVAGAVLTAGFGGGPLVSGLVAQFSPDEVALGLPFALTVALSLSVVVAAARPGAVRTPVGRRQVDPAATPAPAERSDHRRVGAALARSVPMALWVFSSVTVPVVVLAGRVGGEHAGPWVPGVASAVTLGIGVAAQVVARRAGWGPRSGVAGALLAAAGFVVAAVVDATADVALLGVSAVALGSAYGLCLRAGLVDVDELAPTTHRGITIGVFYVATYLGFAVPTVLEALRSPVGTLVPLLVLAAGALVAAAVRAAQLRRDTVTG
ncbi:MFS transporter [Nocardioides caeni]|uniref:MFS transporter n=1 Tax=Nocardioides caeni TaxID=574700 RepID=A0A4S8N598_9ACTN|nr:MFS transporter [Nocardioides caeni]THV11228.1 MFS transporter [Nocardioides caeni]